jgi:3-isopropylmalate dehydrogenase
LVTENMFGDILSDVGAALMGGMGIAPSADIGVHHAMFQPCHGSAPDIAGSGKANPTAMFLSAAMMLDWLGERHGYQGCREAGALLERAVQAAFASGNLQPREMGGASGLKEITAAVTEALEAPALPQRAL